MNIEQMTTIAAEYNNGKNGRALDVRDRYIAALLAQWNALIAGQEPVEWQFRWMNPGDNPNASEDEMSWKPVDLKHWNQSIDGRVAELRAHQYSGKPCYEVRALYTHPAPSTPAAQERAEPVAPAVWETLRTVVDVSLDSEQCKPLYDMLGEDREDLAPIRILIGDGHSGYGLYAASDEYPEEGVFFICSATPPAPAQEREIAAWQARHRQDVNGWSEWYGIDNVEVWQRRAIASPNYEVRPLYAQPAQPSPEPSKPEQAEAPTKEQP